MHARWKQALWIWCIFRCGLAISLWGADHFTAATYNLEQFGLDTAEEGFVKSPEGRGKILEAIQAMSPDVLALQEIESTNALMTLREDLKKKGLEYPYWELVVGADTNRNVAILSRLAITARTPHRNLSFLLHGRRHEISRGFAEVEIRVSAAFSFTLIVAHLKSRRLVAVADEAELREQEALLLREIIDRCLTQGTPLIVTGDFNDTKASRAVRTLLGRGKLGLSDLRPAERNGDNRPNDNPRFDPRNITWTHYFGKEDTYSRIDYILASRELARMCDPEGTYVLALPNWGVASDHRPLVARFVVPGRR
jgi:endonuclease/exonuclease/phosphatase family metal-dependent hydrolase